MKIRKWTYKELNILRFEYPTQSIEVIAGKINRTPQAILQKAFKMGLKKKAIGIEWTPQMLKILRQFFPITFNDALAKWIGVSCRTMIRKARELGLEKVPNFRELKKEALSARISEAQKRLPFNVGRFEKGCTAGAEFRFKPGHSESAETKAKRSASLKKSWEKKKKQQKPQDYTI